MMNGYGKLYYVDDTSDNSELQYIGNFKNNKFSGVGICFHKNGNKFFEGHFANGEPCGEGILYDKDGIHKESAYYIGGKQQKDLSQSRELRLKDRLDKKILFPMHHIHT